MDLTWWVDRVSRQEEEDAKEERDSSEVEAKKVGTMVVGDVLVFLESIMKEVLGLFTIEP